MSNAKVLAICGSLQADSANLRLLRTAATLVPRDVDFEIYDGIASLPFFNPDIAAGDAPVSVQRFRALLTACDAVLIASPEYGHSLPGVLKNAIDWVISSGELYRKVVGVTASAPGPGRGERGRFDHEIAHATPLRLRCLLQQRENRRGGARFKPLRALRF